jgi:hypothetical protein
MDGPHIHDHIFCINYTTLVKVPRSPSFWWKSSIRYVKTNQQTDEHEKKK